MIYKWIPGTSGRMVDMKTVKLLVQKGTNEANSIVEYDDSSADWLITNGYALEVTTSTKSDDKADDESAAPRRGRPRKADKA